MRMSAMGGKADIGVSASTLALALALAALASYSSAMSEFHANFVEPERVQRYTEHGPPAFAPGYGGMLQMIGVLLAERMPHDGQLLVIGAGGRA